MTLEVCARAKINWSLSICGERPDDHCGLELPTEGVDDGAAEFKPPASELLTDVANFLPETGGANA